MLDLSISTADFTCLVFTALGIATAILWLKYTDLPHSLDMTIGMLTLGNLGMLLGWWIDNDFTVIKAGDCCACGAGIADVYVKPWMSIGMLVFANVAMIYLVRQPRDDSRWCRTSMFTGGNIGMGVGLLIGGRLGEIAETGSVPVTAAGQFHRHDGRHGSRHVDRQGTHALDDFAGGRGQAPDNRDSSPGRSQNRPGRAIESYS